MRAMELIVRSTRWKPIDIVRTESRSASRYRRLITRRCDADKSRSWTVS